MRALQSRGQYKTVALKKVIKKMHSPMTISPRSTHHKPTWATTTYLCGQGLRHTFQATCPSYSLGSHNYHPVCREASCSVSLYFKLLLLLARPGLQSLHLHLICFLENNSTGAGFKPCCSTIAAEQQQALHTVVQRKINCCFVLSDGCKITHNQKQGQQTWSQKTSPEKRKGGGNPPTQSGKKQTAVFTPQTV